MRLIKYISVFFLIISAGILAGQGSDELFPPKPEPAVYFNDFSNWLAPVEKNQIEQQLRAMNDTTSTQIVVITKPDIGDFDRSSYATEIGNRWGVGQKDKDNGIIMLIVTGGSQRGVFISTGYGLEGSLTDVVAARIARDKMVPYFKENRYYEGISSGVNAVSAAVHGEYTDDGGREMSPVMPFVIVFIIIFIVIMIMVISNKGGGRMLTGGGTYTGNSGGGFWGGGGFGGGSSSSGGGGWSGGSFGGGSFGGGGGGASW